MQDQVSSSSVFEDFCDLACDFVPCEFKVKWAHNAWEKTEALRLRRAVFCIEQGIFVGDDLDAVDASAQMIVAIACVGGMADQVVGCVRIHQAEPGLWWGSRLAVHPSFRRHSHLATTLIRLAVSSAHARECRIFFAHVQSQNQPLFEKLGWQPLKAETLHGRPHQLMQADMAVYPPCYDPMTGFVTQPGALRERA
jgi:putative N-acetyltransferase (TIGR04045 family)